MVDPVFIRTASERDFPAIRELLVETWHATYDMLFGADIVSQYAQDWASDASLTEKLETPNAEYILADTGRALCGVAHASANKKVVTLQQLYVRPQQQGKGVGTQLMQELFYCFDEAEKMQLQIHPQNAEAIGFFKAGGFKETGKTDWSGPDGTVIPHLVLSRKLDE